MEKVRIGCVKYLNALPLIEGLGAWRDCELVASAPSQLIGMLRRGEVDVALASVIDAARGTVRGVADAKPSTTAPVVLLPVGMIGCEGATLTVRVFSRVPIETIARVAVDADSHTSVALLRVLMWKRYGKRVEIGVLSEERHRGMEASRQRGEEAMLLIGDKVVTDAPPEREYPHQMDLGAAWRELTGLPFVYAVWMCRDGEQGSIKVRAAAMMLERTRLHNATRLDWVVGEHAEERGWAREAAAEYVGSLLKYDVEEREREAVEKFIGWAGEMGLCGGGGVVWGA
jgi:chorismate dehydratase